MQTRFIVGAIAVLAIGCGDITEADEEGSLSDPIIEEIIPASGGVGGGTVATITGQDFTDDSRVIIGGRESDTVEVVSDTEIIFVVPPGDSPTDRVDVTVANERGTGFLSAGFLYNPAPSIYEVSPRGGPRAGGTEIAVFGRGFSDFEAGDNRITIGGVSGVVTEVVSDTELKITTPVADADAFVPLDVEIANSNGSALLAEGFFYTKPGLLAATSRGLIGQGGALFYIDPTNPTPFKLADLPFGITSMSLAPDGRLVVSTRRRGPGPFLAFLDPITAELEIIAPFDTNNSVWVAHIGETLYGYNGGSNSGATDSEVRIVSVTDGTTSPIDPASDLKFGISQASRMARRNDTSLFLCNQMANTAPLYRVSTATGLATTQVELNNVPVSGVCHGLAVVGGQVLAVIWQQPEASVLVSINPANGQVSEIFTADFRMAGLAPTPPGF